MLFIKVKKAEQRFSDDKSNLCFIYQFVLFVSYRCEFSLGTIVIKENEAKGEIVITLNSYNDKNDCKITLNGGDSILIDVENEKGKISLNIIGKKGSNPYTGSDVKSSRFTVTVSESDVYKIIVKGQKATGTVKIKKLK
jgi:hypothetical protein